MKSKSELLVLIVIIVIIATAIPLGMKYEEWKANLYAKEIVQLQSKTCGCSK